MGRGGANGAAVHPFHRHEPGHDEPEVSVMTRRFAFAVPGDLATPTGGYAYDRRMIAELERLGWRADVIDIGSGFPRPSADGRAIALARLAALPQDGCIVIDGLALGALPDEAAALARSHKLVALVHHPLALETGLSAADAERLRESERAALAAVRHVVVTGAVTARLLASDYGVPAERISIARPGTDPVEPSRGSHDGTLALLAVGALVPRKGYDVLLAALATLTHLPWRLTVAGARDRGAET